jgi:hypothetical protein
MTCNKTAAHPLAQTLVVCREPRGHSGGCVYHPLATCDERHTHTGRALWDALDQAKGARRQPLLIRLTGRDQSA